MTTPITPTFLTTKLQQDKITEQVCKDFTIEWTGIHEFQKHIIDKKDLPKDFNIGLIVGGSGSGKSILLNDFGVEETPEWDNSKSVASHFNNYEDATDKLMAVGFNSIPHWLVPYNVLSTGQKYRVDLARTLKDNCIRDEFTSVIDRPTSMSLSNSIQKHVRKKNMKGIVFASVHRDIIPYLQPDWIYDTSTRILTVNSATYDVESIKNSTFKKKVFLTYNEGK